MMKSNVRVSLSKQCCHLSILLMAVTVGGFLPASEASPSPAATVEPPTAGGPVTLRRLNEAQYKNSIAAIFGPAIKVPGRFEPPLREEGLLAIGDGRAVVSASGFEQYELRAREISAQVLAEDKRKNYLSCSPPSAPNFDKACTAKFLGEYGRLLFRRPLTAGELTTVSNLTRDATLQTGDFYKGLQIGLARLLGSAHFIFRVERSIPDSSAPGRLRLDDYSLATRLSFLVWNAPPDAELLSAADTGALRKADALEQQVDRLIASPLFEQGVRAFFSDMFGFEQFEGLSKDQTIYPKFTSALAKSAQEQMLRTIVNLLITERGDYRDLFATKTTFMNRALASLYRVPLAEQASLDGWVRHTFAEEDPRGGMFTLAGFLMLDPTHEGRSSPTIRGKSVREFFLCQKVPLPPPNVDFSAVQNTGDLIHKTARERLSVHQENPACAGCHKITDPIGLSMENYDAIGAFRTHENGTPIDASGNFEGKGYEDLMGLQQALRTSSTVSNCATRRAYEYGVGRPLRPDENKWLTYAASGFASSGYQFPALMRLIATSNAFQMVSADEMTAATEAL